MGSAFLPPRDVTVLRDALDALIDQMLLTNQHGTAAILCLLRNYVVRCKQCPKNKHPQGCRVN